MSQLIDLAGRTLLSFMFFLSGVQKIGSYAGAQAYMESQGVPGMLLPAVIVLEIIAPLLVVVGWQTRAAALGLAGFSIAAGLLFHFDPADQMQTIMLMKNLAIAGGFVLIAARGPGALSLDHRMGRSAHVAHA